MHARQHNFKHKFLKAVDSEAIDAEHIQLLRDVKASLKDDFEREFSPEAFKQHYLGRIKKPVYEDYEYYEEDQELHILARAPKLKEVDFKIHFPHEDIAEELGVNFVELHGSKFYPYFMAAAMHQLTGKPIYDELAGDMLEEIECALPKSIRNGFDPLTQKKYGPLTQREVFIIVNALSASIDCMVQHRRPNSLRASDTIDPLSEEENPGPKPK